jgi:hypothetical protein
VSDLLDKKPQITGITGGKPPVIGVRQEQETGGAPPVIGERPGLIARAERGRFAKGTTGNPVGRFRKGQSGNPKGRPKGSGRFGSGEFRSGTRAAAALLDAEAEFIARQAIELVRAGDPVAVRFCLGRILGVRRGQPIELALPEVAAPRDLSGAVAVLTAALAEGRLTPDEALACSQMLDGLPRVLAAARADKPRQWPDGDDPRKTLARKLARLAKSVEEETLAQSQALATIPGSAGTGPLIETAAAPMPVGPEDKASPG